MRIVTDSGAPGGKIRGRLEQNCSATVSRSSACVHLSPSSCCGVIGVRRLLGISLGARMANGDTESY
jgi:hypothetical protein